MKRPWIKWCALVIAAFAAIVGVPIIINECYKANSGYMTIWGAADVLSYYGTILGTFVTVATIVVTISFTRKQIQRESYLKNETEKWAKIESIFAAALEKVNPIRLLIETMDTGMTNPEAAIMILQKYQMSCQTATDQLIAFLNFADYPKVKVLIDRISNSIEEYAKICEKEIAVYQNLQDFCGRTTAEETLRMEAEHPNAFPENTLSFCRKILDSTDGITLDDIKRDISACNEEMVSAYETTHRNLLQLKGQMFESINMETQKIADSILRFGGKR